MFVEIRVESVIVFTVQVIQDKAQAFTETLIVNDLALAQVADRVTDFRIFHEAQNIVIGKAGFLLWCYLVRITNNSFNKNSEIFIICVILLERE